MRNDLITHSVFFFFPPTYWQRNRELLEENVETGSHEHGFNTYRNEVKKFYCDVSIDDLIFRTTHMFQKLVFSRF